MDELARYYKESLLAGLCGEYKGRWQATHGNKEGLMRLMMMQQSQPHFITFAYEGRGLSKDFFTTYFADYINGRYVGLDVDGVEGGYRTQVYAAVEGDLSLSDDVSCIMWSNIPSARIKSCKAAKIYIGCGSDVHLVCEGFNTVTVMLFDESRVTLDEVDRDSRVNIYRYSDRCSVQRGEYCFGKVNEHQKELRL